jgi:hypothetical protein
MDRPYMFEDIMVKGALYSFSIITNLSGRMSGASALKHIAESEQQEFH